MLNLFAVVAFVLAMPQGVEYGYVRPTPTTIQKVNYSTIVSTVAHSTVPAATSYVPVTPTLTPTPAFETPVNVYSRPYEPVDTVTNGTDGTDVPNGTDGTFEPVDTVPNGTDGTYGEHEPNGTDVPNGTYEQEPNGTDVPNGTYEQEPNVAYEHVPVPESIEMETPTIDESTSPYQEPIQKHKKKCKKNHSTPTPESLPFVDVYTTPVGLSTVAPVGYGAAPLATSVVELYDVKNNAVSYSLVGLFALIFVL
jgi:hypothetical protein